MSLLRQALTKLFEAKDSGAKLAEEEQDYRSGRVDEPGWKYLPALDISLREKAGARAE